MTATPARSNDGDSRVVAPDPEQPTRSRRRLLATIAVVAAAVVVLFHGVGGWYFASVRHQEALDAEARRARLERTYDVEVLAVGDDKVTLDDDDLLARLPGVWGVAGPGGYGLLTGAPTSTASGVERDLDVVTGAAPEPGTAVDVHERAFPDDPALVVGVAPETVVVDGRLGEYTSWFHPGTRSTWILLMHGNGLSRLDLAKLLPAVAAAGYPVLFVTMRNDPGAPQDPSGMLRYGDTEWEDLEAAVPYAVSTGATDVIPVAPSMGGGVALTFLERSVMADTVRGLVLDSPMVDFGRAVDEQAADERLPVIGLPVPGTLVVTAKWFASLRFGVDWDATGHLDEVDRLAVPTLVFHGTAYSDVPIATSCELAEARPDVVTLVEVGDAPHLASWNIDPVAYEATLMAFLDALDS